MGSASSVPLAAGETKTTTIAGSASETWNVAIAGTWSSSTLQGSAPNKSWQMGKSKEPITSATFSTSGIPGTITKIEVACSSKDASAKVNATVGGSAFGTQNQSTPSWTTVNTVTFNGSASGEIVVTIGGSTAATYIRSITVTYTSTFTVTYNANGATSGDVPVDGTAYAENATVTVLGNTGSLAKTNYTFGGWNTKADGTGTVYAAAATFSITSNTNLYAIWNGVPYDITMPSNDSYGTYAASATDDVPYGTLVTLTYTPASGKEIYGAVWSVDGEELSGNTFTMPAKDVTVTVELLDEAKLPFEWAGGTSSELLALPGVTGNSLGDYAESNAPYRVQFNANNDYIQIKTNDKPGVVSFGFKVFTALASNAGTKITIQGSSNGSSFSDVEEFSLKSYAIGTYSLTTTNAFDADVRYVRILFTKGSNGQNVGVGPISIDLPGPANPTTSGDETYLTTSDNMDGWRAFYDASNSYSVDVNTKVYVADADPVGTTITLKAIDGIPAAVPVILHTSSSEDSYKMTLTEKAAATYTYTGTNKLIWTSSAVDNKYRLGFGASGVGFYPYSGTPSSGAVILDIAASARSLTLGFEDEATGVADVRGKMADGRSDIYNLNGQKVLNPTKGLYIMNGKKVIIK